MSECREREEGGLRVRPWQGRKGLLGSDKRQQIIKENLLYRKALRAARRKDLLRVARPERDGWGRRRGGAA